MSKERAAKIANSPGASKKGGTSSGSSQSLKRSGLGLGRERPRRGRGRPEGRQGDGEKEEELSVTQTSERGQAERQRDLDRELDELLQELRVMLPGVQVLLAFLLTVPFTNRFDTLTEGERGVDFAAVALTSLAIVLLMTPGIQHRLRFREHDKEALLEKSNQLLIAVKRGDRRRDPVRAVPDRRVPLRPHRRVVRDPALLVGDPRALVLPAVAATA